MNLSKNTNIPPKISPYISPERADSWEDAGELSGDVVCEGCPAEREENNRGLCGGNDWGNERKKLQKLSFLRFEMVRKSAIFQQTNGQKSWTICSF